jgi:hypothetical protein
MYPEMFGHEIELMRKAGVRQLPVLSHFDLPQANCGSVNS